MPHDPRIAKAVDVTRLGWRLVSAKLRMFVQEMEDCLQQRLDSLSAKHQAKLEELKQTTGQVPIAWDELDDILKIDGLPTLMRDSLFLVVFGVYEHHVAGLCDRIMRTGAIAASGPAGSHLHQSKDFLQNEVGAATAAFSTDWDFLDRARHARNYVAHEAATIGAGDRSSQAEKARQFVQQTAHIAFDGDRITIEAPFLPALIDRMDGVFSNFADVVR